MITPPRQLADFIPTFESLSSEVGNRMVVAGFDGFVDEFISVVDKRSSETDYQAIPTITDFGTHVSKAAGRSSLREIVIQQTDAGGCSVNLGDGLANLGVPLHLFSTLGNPIHPAFQPLLKKFAFYQSWGSEYGRTLAFEFQDGKLMFSAVTQLREFTPQLLDTILQDTTYISACEQASLIALTNWTLYPHMTACWKKLLTEVYSNLSNQPWFFFDLVDPTGRSQDAIQDMLATLPSFSTYGKTILGLNINEAHIVSKNLGITSTQDHPEEVQQQAALIRKKLAIDEVVIHATQYACAASQTETIHIDGPYCASPLKSTGAGDRFNAGYSLGRIHNRSLTDALILGNACSGYFVRNATSANPTQLKQFLHTWLANELDPT
jgi:hypothetical protein